MNYTDDQLKQLLAKMLPETVAFNDMGSFIWTSRCDTRQVLETELLHICSLVEDGLTERDRPIYAARLHPKQIHHHLQSDFLVLHATWQQRTAALAGVKGVTL